MKPTNILGEKKENHKEISTRKGYKTNNTVEDVYCRAM